AYGPEIIRERWVGAVFFIPLTDHVPGPLGMQELLLAQPATGREHGHHVAHQAGNRAAHSRFAQRVMHARYAFEDFALSDIGAHRYFTTRLMYEVFFKMNDIGGELIYGPAVVLATP